MGNPSSSPSHVNSTVTSSLFADGNDAALLALVPEATKLEAPEAEEEVNDFSSEGAAGGDEDTAGSLPAEEEEGEAEEHSTPSKGEGEGETEGEGTNKEKEEETAPEIESLRRENEELKAKAAVSFAVAPTRDQPLAHITSEEDLKRIAQNLVRLNDWLNDNRDGGELPKELTAFVTDRKAEDVTQLMTLDAAGRDELRERTRERLIETIPARAQFLQVEKVTTEAVRKERPELFDPKKPEGQALEKLLKHHPHLKLNPEWAAFAKTWVRGWLAEQTEQKSKTEKPAAKPPLSKTTGKPTVLAPAPSIGGARTKPTASAAAVEKATARIEAGNGTDADLELVLSLAS